LKKDELPYNYELDREDAMSKTPRLKIITVILVVNLLACTTPPKTAPDLGSAVAEFPVMSIGDTWVSSHFADNHGTAEFSYTVTSVESDGSFDIKRENNKDTKREFKHFDSTATGVPMMMGIQYDPEALQFPIFVGKAWETEAQTVSTDGDYYTYKTRYVVDEYTIVKTKGGTFEAFLIKSRARNLGTNWKGTGKYWYAPEAKTIVKSTHSHIRGIEFLKVDLVE